MKGRLLIKEKQQIKRFLLCAALVLLSISSAFAASGRNFTAEEMRRMGVFLSNFTELGFMTFDAGDLTNENDPADMIRFGIRHNYINNFRSRIAQCRVNNCRWGSLTIEGKHVTESIKKYFDVNFTRHTSVTDSDPPYHYDGTRYHFQGADGEAIFYARVDKAVQNSSGQIVMTGELYDSDNKDHIIGSFEALAKPYKYGGRDTWSIISLRSQYH